MLTDLVPVQMFKATRHTHRFRKNQKVWIKHMHANHLDIRHKWKGKGRMVNGTISKFADEAAIGEIKTIDVAHSFAKRILDECHRCDGLLTHNHFEPGPWQCTAPRLPWTVEQP